MCKFVQINKWCYLLKMDNDIWSDGWPFRIKEIKSNKIKLLNFEKI